MSRWCLVRTPQLMRIAITDITLSGFVLRINESCQALCAPTTTRLPFSVRAKVCMYLSTSSYACQYLFMQIIDIRVTLLYHVENRLYTCSKREPMITIDHNLFALKRQLELKTGKSYKWTEIESATGVHRNTLQNLSKNATRRLDLDIWARLYNYLRAEGLDIQPCDLFAFTEHTAGE